MQNQNVAIINQFEIPQLFESDFLKFFNFHIELVSSQPGNLECSLFKVNDNKNILKYISIVRWENQEALKKAKSKIDLVSKKEGIDIKKFQDKYNIKVINHMCSKISIL